MTSSRLSRWNPWHGLDGLPRDVWVLALTTLVNRAGSMVLPFLALYVTQELKYSAGRAGFVLGLYGLGSIVAAPISGRLCDRFGARRIMRNALFLSGTILVLFPLAKAWPALLAATLLLTATAEGYRPASLAALTDAAPPDRRKAAFAVNRLAINLGMSVGPAVGGFLAAVSYPAIFWVDGVTSILAGFVLVFWPVGSDAKPTIGVHAGGEAAPSRSRPARRDGAYLVFLLACLPVIVVFFQHVGAMPLHLVRDLGFSASFFGLLFTLNTVIIVLLEVRLNIATAHWPHARTLALGAILVGAGFGALGWSHTAWAIVATVVVWTFGEMILLPSMSAYVADLAPPDRRGEYMGLYSMTWGFAFSFGPGLGTAVLDRLGATTLWPACFVVAAMSAVLLGRLRPRPAPRPPDQRLADGPSVPNASA